MAMRVSTECVVISGYFCKDYGNLHFMSTPRCNYKCTHFSSFPVATSANIHHLLAPSLFTVNSFLNFILATTCRGGLDTHRMTLSVLAEKVSQRLSGASRFEISSAYGRVLRGGPTMTRLPSAAAALPL